MTKKLNPNANTSSHWPNGAQLIISISMQFEAGGQPEGAESPFSGAPLPAGFPDLPAKTWFEYGYKEGILRLLALWDKYDIKVTSHMVGEAVLKNPELAKLIVKHGHEAAGHGMNWSSQYNMKFDEEKKFVEEGAQAVEKITGQKPVGYNCNWLRRSVNTLEVLQNLGFLYHIDDVSRDEPFITFVKDKQFITIPYTVRCNDIVLIEGKGFSAQDFLNQIKLEFDHLYKEGKHKRRMMSVSLHDRIGGTPAMAEAMENFIMYAMEHPNVVFMRKDEIAKMVEHDQNTLVEK